jgi:hypothetical protein
VRGPLNLVEAGEKVLRLAAEAPPPSQSSLFACSPFLLSPFGLHYLHRFPLAHFDPVVSSLALHLHTNPNFFFLFITYPHVTSSPAVALPPILGVELRILGCELALGFSFFWGDRKS